MRLVFYEIKALIVGLWAINNSACMALKKTHAERERKRINLKRGEGAAGDMLRPELLPRAEQEH